MRLLLVPWGETEWDADGRLIGQLDVPLSAAGLTSVRRTADELAAMQPAAVISSRQEAAAQTAGVIAHRLGLRARRLKDLHEVSLGHWEGLTSEQLAERFPSAFRPWHDEPLSVCPPEGEGFRDAAARLREALYKALRHTDEGAATVVVTGPLAVATLRQSLGAFPAEELWTQIEARSPVYTLDLPNAEALRDLPA